MGKTDSHRAIGLLRSCTLGFALAWGSSVCLAAGAASSLPRLMWLFWLLTAAVLTAALAKGGWALVLMFLPAAVLAWQKLLVVGLPGYAVCLCTCRAVCRGKGTAIALTGALLPLLLCLARPQAQPGRVALFVLLWGAGMLLLTQQVRQQHPRQSTLLTAAAAPVLAAVLGALLVLNPPQSYVNRSAAVRELLRCAVPISQGAGRALAAVTAVPGRVVLRSAPQAPSEQTVFTVQTQESGARYLRLRSYDRYDGSAWSAAEDAIEAFSGPGTVREKITVRTRGALPFLLTAYYPPEGVTLVSGGVANTAGLTQYTLERTALLHSPVTQALPVPESFSPYLELPEETRLAAGKFLSECSPPEGSASEKAAAIGAYLRQGRYTLSPRPLPEEEDALTAFLENGMEGSCTHFASAAAVLLRCAGVPARLVGGYLVEAKADQETAVTEKNAHAWAEFYEPALDAWLILEATPPAASPNPEAAEHVAAPAPAGKGFRLLILSAPVLAAEAQFWVRRLGSWLRRRRSSTNRRAILYWREARLLSRLLGEAPEPALAAAARKAFFSQHRLTEAELAVFEDAIRRYRGRLRKIFFGKRLVLRWVYGVY